MAEGTELGKAYVQIIPSAKGISGKIKEALGDAPAQTGESAGQSLGSRLVSTFKKVIAAGRYRGCHFQGRHRGRCA